MIKRYFYAMKEEFKTVFGFILAAGMGFFVMLNIIGIYQKLKKLRKKNI